MLLRLRVVACAEAIPDRILFAVRKYILACIPRVSNHLAFIHSGRQHRNSRRRFVHACAPFGSRYPFSFPFNLSALRRLKREEG